MKRRLFEPAPDALRCDAVVYLGSYGFPGRCPYRRADDNLCKLHSRRRAAGKHVVVRQWSRREPVLS